MGLCLGRNAESVDPETEELSKKVETQLKTEFKLRQKARSLLILGAGGCGKSTFISQIKCMYGKDFAQEFNRSRVVPVLRNNILSTTSLMLDRFSKDKTKHDNPEETFSARLPGIAAFTADFCQLLAELADISATYSPSSHIVEGVDFAPLAKALSNLIATPTWQNELWPKLESLHLPDAARFLFESHTRILDENFDPTAEDCMWIRLQTSGVIDYTFEFQKVPIKVTDVGGQRSERSKWIHCFSDVDVLVFFASLGEYDLTLDEDPTTNRMHESLTLWEELVNSRWFQNKPLTLLLNKRDIFEKKFPLSPLSKTFIEFTQDQDLEKGLEFIANKFLSCVGRKSDCTVHFTCATHSDMIRTVIQATIDALLTTNLTNSGLV